MNVLANHEIEYIRQRPSQEAGLLKDNNVLKAFGERNERTVNLKNSAEQLLTANGDMVLCYREMIRVRTWKDVEQCVCDDKSQYVHEAKVNPIEPKYRQAI